MASIGEGPVEERVRGLCDSLRNHRRDGKAVVSRVEVLEAPDIPSLRKK